MTPDDLAFIQSLPALAFQAVLLFARLAAAAMLLPGLGEQDVPPMLRLGLALTLLALLLPSLAPALPATPDDSGEAARMIAQEVVVGLWFGGLARLVALAFTIAGQLVATLIGLQQMLGFDPDLGGQATAIARAFGLATAVLVLATGLYEIALRALAESYALLPAGAPMPTGLAAETIAMAGAASLELALRLAAPFVVGAVVLNVALGLLARLAPQVQIFFVAIPGQIVAGIALLALLAPALIATYAEGLRAAFNALPAAR
jgi:flagellar biosynthetic protein FliR